MLRFARGLHTTCRVLESAASGPAKPTPKSLGFAPIDASRTRILPSLGPGRNDANNDTHRRPREASQPRQPRQNQPRQPQPQPAERPNSQASEFFEGAELAAAETRQPTAFRSRPPTSRGPRPRGASNTRPSAGVCYNCNETGHIAAACPKPRQARAGPPRARRVAPRRLQRNDRGSLGEVPYIPIKEQLAEVAKKMALVDQPTSMHALFGTYSVLRPFNKFQRRKRFEPRKVKEPQLWAEGMERAEIRRVEVLRKAGDYSTQVLPLPLDGTAAQRAAWTISMNRTIDPKKRVDADSVFKEYM